MLAILIALSTKSVGKQGLKSILKLISHKKYFKYVISTDYLTVIKRVQAQKKVLII